MRIAMISRYLPSDSKMGVGYQVHALANAMVARGHTVTVFSQSPRPEGAQYAFERVPVRPPLRALRASWYLRSVDWSRFDVLHAHGDDWFLWNKSVPPHVRTIHGSCLAEAANIPGLKKKCYMLFLALLETLSCAVADQVVAVSGNTCRSYPWIKTVIPNGVNVAAFRPAAAAAARLQGTGDGGQVGAALRSMGNDQRAMSNDGGSSPQSHKDTKNDDGSRVTGDEGKNLEPGIENLEEKGREALPQHSGSPDVVSSCLGGEQKQNTAPLAGAPHSNSYLLTPNSSPKESSATILFVGTFGNRKRGKLLMEVFSREIRPALPAAQLWMVCSDAPAAAGVTVFGRIPEEQLTDLYRRAWVFCLPSTYEGFGIPYIEAMASGTAVVASPNVGAVEVTRNGKDGLVVEDDKLGAALLNVLTDENLRHKLEAAGLERVKDFDLNSVCERYEAVYAAAAATAKNPGVRS